MGLEKELDKSFDSEKSSNIINYFYGAVIIGVLVLAGYLCCEIGQDILEKSKPTFLETNTYLPSSQ